MFSVWLAAAGRSSCKDQCRQERGWTHWSHDWQS